ERAANDVIANARQVLHAAAADEAHRVLLQVMPLARDVAGDFHPVGEADARHLAKRRVRLLRRRRIDANAHATLLGAGLERRGRGLALLLIAAGLHELIDRRHLVLFSRKSHFHAWTHVPAEEAGSLLNPRVVSRVNQEQSPSHSCSTSASTRTPPAKRRRWR